MSINNSILKLLNMKDKNLNFNENFVVEREIKNKRCLVILGYLKNDFEFMSRYGNIVPLIDKLIESDKTN